MRTPSIRHAFTAAMCGLLFGVTFLLASAPARAQTSGADEIQIKPRKLSAEEETRLRVIINTPTDRSASYLKLETQLYEKKSAAEALGEWPAIKTIYQEIAETSSICVPKNDLAWLYIDRGDIAQGDRWMQEAVKAAPDDFYRGFYFSNLALQKLRQNKLDEVRLYLSKTDAAIKASANVKKNSFYQSLSFRTLANSYLIRSVLEEKQGRWGAALDLANKAKEFAANAVKASATLKDESKLRAYATLVSTLRRTLEIQTISGKNADAQTTLNEIYRIYKEGRIVNSAFAFILNDASRIQFSQRDFSSSVASQQRSLSTLQELGFEAVDIRLTTRYKDIAQSLIGGRHYQEALTQYVQLDSLAGSNETLQERVRYPFDRAVVYLYNNKALEAAPLLASESPSLAKQYGATSSGKQHFFTAQASGLQGVALWRVGTPESKAAAYPLLQTAVRDIMAPENVDYLENIGIRKELREMIFSTYIEAASQTNPADALAALGIADWLRGGLVQEALGDAAVRAAASNTALSDLVRQDQDARNETKGLRNYLSGEAGGAASPLPEIAAKMRERIALLEKTRADVQIKIKAAFPDYEKLVRPLPPATAEIQAKLKADEALVVVQPTDHATYVWVVNREGRGQFHRAPVDEATLKRLVTRLRSTLDVAGYPANRMPAFDSSAAQELYQKLLAPVQSGFAGKTSLIVAAGGALGQIPFGVLQTGSKDSWLIQQAAITHVPSVAAWLSMRSLPHKTAPEAMLAWGDPLFNVALANTGKSSAGDVRKVNLTRANTAVDLEKEDPRSALKYADIPALPETRDELQAIAKTLGADAAKDLILGSQATRESVLEQNKNGNLAKRRVVAFATHGLMAGDLPNLTQPALAMAGTKDGTTNVLAPLLTLEDVLGLKLNADWVVLSACNTAAADGKAEEALSGLARGFFYAGSRSLLVTHWAVDSDSAVTLTTETFKNYQSKPTEAKAESLRQAMLTVMRDPKTAHPAYWAPYALVGDGAR